jgi:1,4-alpha-glucan branching enzyme
MLAPEYPPAVIGGLGRHVGELTRLLSRSEAVDVYAPVDAASASPPIGVRLHEVRVPPAPSYQRFWLAYCDEAIRLAAGRDADVVHAHEWMTALAGANLAALLRKPLVVNVHLPQSSAFNAAIENVGLAHADLVIVNSEAVRDELLSRRGVRLAEVAVVPNGVDTVLFRPRRRERRDPGRVLFAGRLAPQKGVDVLLRAFEVVLRRRPDASLRVLGDGDQELYLRRFARYLGVARRVEFCGWCTDADLVENYRSAAVVAVPSRYEPFGLVAVEAMACGVPVVASRVGGVATVVEDGVSGYLVEPANYLELAQRIVALLVDEAGRAAMGRAARARAALFTWAQTASRTLELYRGVERRRDGDASRNRARLAREILRVVDADAEPAARALLEVL